MPSVRCPSCDTAQHVEAGSSGYTCSSCGKEWSFVVCRSCGSRFHAKPGATTWTCPRCGLLQDASADPPPETAEPAVTPTPVRITDADLARPQEPPPSDFPPGLGLGDDDEGPQDAFAMPVRESSGRPLWIYVAIAVAAAVVLVLLFNVIFGGDDGGGEAPPDDGGQASAEQATATMCTHVQQIQVFRDDALGAAAEELQGDVTALKGAGDKPTAKQVKAVIAAIGAARDDLANQEDTTASFEELQRAIRDLPC